MSSDWSQLPARLTFRQARSLLDAYEWNEQRFMDQCTIPASAYFEWRASVVLKLLRDGKPVDRMAALKDLAVLAAGYGPDDPPKAAIAAAGGIETLVAVLGADQAELHVGSLLILSKLDGAWLLVKFDLHRNMAEHAAARHSKDDGRRAGRAQP